MQTLVQVVCTPGLSMRDAIADDPKLDRHHFEIVLERKAGRFPGWTKLRSRAGGRRGSINMQWNAATRVLSCRVVNKGSGKPNLIIGDFVDYLLQRHRRRIKLITVLPG
ncbi:MAG TPA: hypothetical protein VF814_07695 [Casimicrobiaceae bacterium]